MDEQQKTYSVGIVTKRMVMLQNYFNGVFIMLQIKITKLNVATLMKRSTYKRKKKAF